MSKFLFIGFIVLLFSFNTSAQSVRSVNGVVQDTSGITMPGSSVRLVSATDTIAAITDINGVFNFPSVKSAKFKLTVSSISFKTFTKKYTVDAKSSAVTLPPIQLHDSYSQLHEVVIEGITPVVVKEDTVQYDARAYPVREGDAVDEMVKRLPGMEVDKDGNVKAEGEPVTKIRLNGKDYFGDEAAAALQNLPADIVKNIQLIDDYGEEANLSGIKSGDPQKIININTKEDKKNGYFARAEAGAGSKDRYTGRFRGNRFKGDQQVSLDATTNNTSNGSNGTTKTTGAKINYRDKWGDKIDSYGSYRFRRNNNNTLEQKVTQSIFQDYTKVEDENSRSNQKDYAHSLSWNLEYAMDSVNYFKLKPNLSYSSANSASMGSTLTNLLSASSLQKNNSDGNTSSSDVGTELYYNHKFHKKRRSLSLSAVIDMTHGDNDNDLQNDYTNTDSLGNVTTEQQYQYRSDVNKNTNTRLRVAYIEPLSEKSFLELNYQWNRTSTGTIRNTHDIDPVTGEETVNENLSNHYDYQFITNRAGFNYRYVTAKLNYFAGLAIMPSVLKGEDLSRNIITEQKTINWVPSARMVYKFSKKQSLIIRYNGRSNQPGFTQLQPITDNSDIQNVVTGNPDLKPEFTNSLGAEYKQTDWGTGYIMNSRIDIKQTNNKIVTTKVIDPETLKQTSTFVNTSGFYNANLNYSFSKPFSDRQYTLTYYGGSTYSNNIAFTNNERIAGKNLELNQGLRFRLDIEDVTNAELNTSFSYNKTRYSPGVFSDRDTKQYLLELEGRTYFYKDLTLGYDFSKTFNSGYNTGNTSPIILNLYLDYRFLKGHKGSVKFQAYDLLNQNTAIARDVFDNVIVDSQTNRLSRYFMLTFQYRLERFGR